MEHVDKNPEKVRAMFGGIARDYDLMNTLMTLGRDRSWRRYVAAEAAPPPGGSVLDIGCGTGGIALTLAGRYPGVKVTGADFTEAMLDVARTRPGAGQVEWKVADATALPFADGAFDAVTSGYLVRNVPDPLAAFREQARVVRPGGRVVCLETAPPPGSMVLPLVNLHLKYVIPLLGSMVARDRGAYTYLPETTKNFLSPDALARVVEKAGLTIVRVRRFMFGTQTVITAIKK